MMSAKHTSWLTVEIAAYHGVSSGRDVASEVISLLMRAILNFHKGRIWLTGHRFPTPALLLQYLAKFPSLLCLFNF